MGVWNWLFGRSPSQDASPENAGASVSASGAAVGTATAVAEPPQGDDAPWYAPAENATCDVVEPVRPQMPPAAASLEQVLLDHFDGHDVSLPNMPRGPERVLGLLSNSSCSITEIAEAIGGDQVLAATVLRMANSPMYRGQQVISGLEPAVVRLGTKAIRYVMLQQSMRAATFPGGKRGDAFAEALWLRALAGSVVARSLGKLVRFDIDTATLLGLLRDIGSVMVLRLARGHDGGRYDQFDWDSLEYLCHECHQEFGELIADAWGLPRVVREVIRNHHKSPANDDPLRQPRLLVQATDMIVAAMGYGPQAEYDLMAARPIVDLGLSGKSSYRDLLESLPELVDEQTSLF